MSANIVVIGQFMMGYNILKWSSMFKYGGNMIKKTVFLSSILFVVSGIYGMELPLYYISSKNIESLKKWIAQEEEKGTLKNSINKAGDLGITLLISAISNNNPEMVKLLLKNGAKNSINTPNISGMTPLSVAINVNNLDIVKLLLANGAKDSINKDNKLKSSFLYITRNNQSVVVYPSNTPLYWAIKQKNEKIVKLLICFGANITKKIRDDLDELNPGETIVHLIKEPDSWTKEERKKFLREEGLGEINPDFGTRVKIKDIKNKGTVIKFN